MRQVLALYFFSCLEKALRDQVVEGGTPEPGSRYRGVATDDGVVVSFDEGRKSCVRHQIVELGSPDDL